MQYSLFAAAGAALVGMVAAQASPTTLLPPSLASGCASTYNNGADFQIGIVNASAATGSMKAKRATNPNSEAGNTLMLTLSNGSLRDSTGRYGYIASNNQLQFDNPIQSDALYTAGFSACPNGTLALESALFYECLSTYEGMSFYNLYDESIGSQCIPAFIQIIGAPAATASSTTSVATSALTTSSLTSTVTPVTMLSDGQIAASTSAATTYTSAVTLGTNTTSAVYPAYTGTAAIISQITDGQIQAPTNATTLLPYTGAAAHPVTVSFGLIFSVVFAGVVGFGAFLL